MEKLAIIENAGDIVLVSRVVVNESLSLCGLSGSFYGLKPSFLCVDYCCGFVQIQTRGSDVYALFNKGFSTFALFEGRGSSIKEFVPYQISPRYKPRDQDKKNIMQLREWFLSVKTEGTILSYV